MIEYAGEEIRAVLTDKRETLYESKVGRDEVPFFKGNVSRDGHFLLKDLIIRMFCMCADGFQNI